ncbi:hypothetical protein EGW08_004592 [Elysia chlorotica]|uniref:Nuclear receptor domain-containing protein n=1 Tax=Elysia chlorotica TaxID=188477 RepID=A0A433U1F4_ELYCH|nr:hypothetical protein EGW08_004592 [Elysia chlorotica]
MARKEKPESIEVQDGQELCRVCGDLSNGVHFGVFTCEGCKKFFCRGQKEHTSYMCKEKGVCRLTPQSRNSCRLCRYQKCISVGMSRTAVKMGRPRKLFASWELTGASSGHPCLSSRDTGGILTCDNDRQPSIGHGTTHLFAQGNKYTWDVLDGNMSVHDHKRHTHVCNRDAYYRCCNSTNVKCSSFDCSTFNASPRHGKNNHMCGSAAYNPSHPGSNVEKSEHSMEIFEAHIKDVYGNSTSVNNVASSSVLDQDNNAYMGHFYHNKHKLCSNGSLRQCWDQRLFSAGYPVSDIYKHYKNFYACGSGRKPHSNGNPHARMPEVASGNNLGERYFSPLNFIQSFQNRQVDSRSTFKSHWPSNLSQQDIAQSQHNGSLVNSVKCSNPVPKLEKNEPFVGMSNLTTVIGALPTCDTERCVRGSQSSPSNYKPGSFNLQQNFICSSTCGNEGSLPRVLLPLRPEDISAVSSSHPFAQNQINNSDHHSFLEQSQIQDMGSIEYSRRPAEYSRKRKISISDTDFDSRKQPKFCYTNSSASVKNCADEESIESRNICSEAQRKPSSSPSSHSEAATPLSVNYLYIDEESFQDINTIFASDDDLNDDVFKPFNYSPRELTHFWCVLATAAVKSDPEQKTIKENQTWLPQIRKAYAEQLKTCGQGLKAPLNALESEIWPAKGQDADQWRHLQEDIARQTFAETKFVLNLARHEGFLPAGLVKLTLDSGLFSNTILMSSREWFDKDLGAFKFFWNWKLPSDHPLVSFQNKIVVLGKRISDLNMDDSEVSLLSALNIANPSIGACPSERIPKLFSVMAPLRHMSLWFSNLIRNMRADPCSLDKTLHNLSQKATEASSPHF